MSLFGGRRREEAEGPSPESREPRGAEPRGPEARVPTRPDGSGSIATGGSMANIGKSISIQGDLSGNEDLVIEGRVDGKIELPSNQVTVGADGHVSAEVHAKSVVIVGKLTGNVNATERVEIQASGQVNGDVRAPRLAVEEGAVLNGSVETGPRQGQSASASLPRPTPAPEKTPAATERPAPEKSAASGH